VGKTGGFRLLATAESATLTIHTPETEMADDEMREGEPRPTRRRPADDDDRDREEDDRPRRRRRRDADEDSNPAGDAALAAVVPVGVSIWAMVSLYSALLSCVIPGLGLIGIFAGIMALVASKKQQTSYGSVTGNIRAVIGIVLGLLNTVFHAIMLIALLMGR
jgi:hypothetical protein